MKKTPIENKTITKALSGAQKKVENRNFDSRKNVVQYDDVMNRHRKATYVRRRTILEQDDISKIIKNLIDDEITRIATSSPVVSDDEIIKKKKKDKIKQERRELIIKELGTVIPLGGKDRKQLEKVYDDELKELAIKKARSIYKTREKDFGEDTMRQVERQVYLQIMDQLWMQHLENMQHLREGINWRSVGQRDPLV
jgi:preprotein translocase subunit SecA